MSEAAVHYFGVRHHGPGCARSLAAALAQLQPDLLLVEGPPEADALLHFVGSAELAPPVALLAYATEAPQHAVFYPFAEFSPEWQALLHAQRAGIPARFIDLPQSAQLLAPEPEPGQEEAEPADAEAAALPAEALSRREDPLAWLGRAAGFEDGEAWWNHLVEERVDATDLFAAISDAMAALRAEFPDEATPAAARREALREAHMRRCVREAQKEGWQRIAVVCGAWHVPALKAPITARADQDLLKGLPKSRVTCTWIPWTYRHLSLASGYGAGVRSPGWYEHLWRTPPERRAIAWMTRAGRLLRASELDCSPAQVIDAARVADTLAALRGRATLGLADIEEALLAGVCFGDQTPLKLIDRELNVGQRLGRVPADVPMVALQKDLEQQQKAMRLKPEALEKTLDLDLRDAGGLGRSRLLHRLRLLGVGWGELGTAASRGRGSFHEVWQLRWQPEFALAVIEASRWGSTVEQAAAARTLSRAGAANRLGELTALLDPVLLADLPVACAGVMQALADRAAMTGDVLQLLEAIPPLARVYRYGDVRGTRPEQVGPVLEGLLLRVCVGLVPACHSLDDDAARQMRGHILAMDEAVRLIDDSERLQLWRQALRALTVLGSSHGLVCGVAARLLFDAGAEAGEEALLQFSQALSVATAGPEAAAWLEGFLQDGGLLLVHDERLWRLVDAWLCALTEDHFLHILPLVRRTFATFNAHERHQLAARSRHGMAAASARRQQRWDEQRAAVPLPFLHTILGLEPQS